VAFSPLRPHAGHLRPLSLSKQQLKATGTSSTGQRSSQNPRKLSPREKHETLAEKQLKQKGLGDGSAECLLSKCEALSSIPSTTKTKRRDAQRHTEGRRPCGEAEIRAMSLCDSSYRTPASRSYRPQILDFGLVGPGNHRT
jgi:hypothetical protein